LTPSQAARSPGQRTLRTWSAPARGAVALAAAACLAGCVSAPPVNPPSLPDTPAYKEAPPGWIAAAPADTLERGPWWQLFGDPVLDDLAQRVEVSNQNIAAAVAAYEQAQALERQGWAVAFPSLTLGGGATRSGGGSRSQSTVTTTGGGIGTTTTSGNNGTGNRYQLSVGASWTPDVWGRLRLAASAEEAQAQATAADLAGARLSAVGTMVADYLNLRETDAEAALLRDTIAAYAQALTITQNRYAAGIAPKTDVLQAQTQLASARADLAGLERTRAQLEHAIAVLVGEPPARFNLAPAPWRGDVVPAVPAGVPSALLQRRPDVAAAERQVAAANAQIGVARTGYFPDFTLNASDGFSANEIGNLLKSSANVWSLGLSFAQTLFDAGATGAKVDQARAAWRQAVAQYRQTALSAFQAVEDQLAAARVLEQQQALRREASQAADLSEAQVMNRYRAGQVDYTEVVTAQVTAWNARRALMQATVARQTAAVSLIQALGGGWDAGQAPQLSAASAAPRAAQKP
jgi:NodT family efflux transporter outer membrane factor (OMF) lipoprotein